MIKIRKHTHTWKWKMREIVFRQKPFFLLLQKKFFKRLNKIKFFFRKSSLEKKEKIVFIVVFAFLLSLPLLLSGNSQTGTVLLKSEKPIEPPSVEWKKENFVQSTKFFEQQFPFRKNLLGFSAFLKEHILASSPNEKVVLGKDGWIFLADSFRSPKMTEEQLEKTAEKIADFQKKVEAQGKKFLFFPVPDKESVYPEYQPFLAHFVQKDNWKPLLAKLQEKNVAVFSCEAMLKTKKTEYLLYSKKDTHWNRLAVSFCINQLLQNLQMEPLKFSVVSLFHRAQKSFVHKTPFFFTTYERKGDLSDMMGKTEKETLPDIAVLLEKETKRPQKVLIYHDSFGLAFARFSEIFAELTLKDRRKNPFQQEIKNLPKEVNVVMIQVVERDLPFFLGE